MYIFLGLIVSGDSRSAFSEGFGFGQLRHRGNCNGTRRRVQA